ncbi:PepSY domain-containing protein [Gilvimarinus chinensis]|uniref:PepSY domain-containing protein n=1 Tax=Gilvimarinus chinensis TaxID=396005 RepID=UPI00035C6247|nr:PepSY domain-containing protein [Gilvimarinus chinensis]
MAKWLIPVFLAAVVINAQAGAPNISSPYAGEQAYCAINAAQAGKIASKTFGGKVIDIKRVQAKGKPAYRVKLLQKSGRIHSVLIDAASGRPIK